MSQAEYARIEVNGTDRRVPTGTTLREVVQEVVGRSLRPDGTRADDGRLAVAAAVSGAVVPRAQWHRTVLTEGARIDVVTAAQGG